MSLSITRPGRVKHLHVRVDVGQLRSLSLFARVHVESFHSSLPQVLGALQTNVRPGGCKVAEKASQESQEAPKQSADSNNLGMVISLPDLTQVYTRASGQATTYMRERHAPATLLDAHLFLELLLGQLRAQ